MPATHPFLIIKENKLWIAKGIFVLFSFLSIVIYFAKLYHTVHTHFSHCPSLSPSLLSIGLLCTLFTTSSIVIFIFQWRKRDRQKEYSSLELDSEGEDVIEGYQEEASEKRVKMVRGCCAVLVYLMNLVLSLLLVALLISYTVLEGKTLPKINGTLNLKGLISDATIQRESNGVIHIKANNVHDMYFAQGVAMAQERLWQMEFHRRLGQGTLSQVLGNATLDLDILFRTLGFEDAAKAGIEYLSPEAQAIGNAFIEGVNGYLQSDPPLPAEFHLLGFKPNPFTVADAMLMVKILALQLAGNYNRELLYHELLVEHGIGEDRLSEFVPDYPDNVPTILDDDDIKHINFTHRFIPINYTRTFPASKRSTKSSQQRSHPKIRVQELLKQSGLLTGLNFGFKSQSNNWVVNGSRTASGKPLLCNDPHLTISAPSIWILMHLESPNVSVIGATPVGAPGIVIGRNADIAWGVTNTYVDVQDLYTLQTSSDDISYYYNNSWINFDYRTELIPIKDLADYRLQVRETIYGPVVSDIMEMQGATAALRWTSLDDNDTSFNTFVRLSTAKNFNDFREALREYVGPSQNFIYADTAGNIGYQVPGRIPARVPGHTGLYPVPGNGSYDWIGWIPYDELPYVLNPSKGYIVTANNKVTPPSYPYLLLNNKDWEEHYRALRITIMLNSTNQNSVNTMKDVQFDRHNGVFFDLLPLLSSISDSLLSTKEQEWKQKLLKWDSNETPDSLEATVFEYWFFNLGKLGAETGFYSWAYPYFMVETLTNESSSVCKGSCSKSIASAFSDAVKDADNKKWGDVHKLYLEHPIMSQSPIACLYDRESPIGGSSYTPNLGMYESRFSSETNDPFASYVGPSYRQIVDLSNMEQSLFIIPMGNSGNVMSGNYDNMLEDFLTSKYVPMKMRGYKAAHSLKIQ